MTSLPVIVGYGGANAAGRSSFGQGFRRMILESLPAAERQRTIVGLAAMMKLVQREADGFVDQAGDALTPAEIEARFAEAVTGGTLIRKIEDHHFDPDATPWQKTLKLNSPEGGALEFEATERSLPDVLPEGWQVRQLGEGKVAVTVLGNHEWRIPTVRDFPVKAAGQLPSGFDPGSLYNSRFQPRGLQMAIYGASDAVFSMGIDWQLICGKVRPDEIGMYASSCLSQMNEEAWGGCIKSRWVGGRPTSKQVPMALNSMPADFVNAYVLGNVGHTEAISGACASFLYNLQAAVRDITAGRRRVAFVGGSEAPITQEVLEGFFNMSALASGEAIAKIDGVESADPRSYSRPFGYNAGFVMGESSQYVILMDDALAIELGAVIHGAVPGVFMDADGVKKSISSPGPGNYITMAKAAALTASILGEETLQNRSLVFAHGSSTPQNRVTESLIFDRIAKTFGIYDWPVCAVKAYVGHSMATASGDQLVAALGVMGSGWMPGIKTIDKIADDVYGERLHIPVRDLEMGTERAEVSLINAKGFGGNNATGIILSSRVAEQMLARRYGSDWEAYRARRAATEEVAANYEQVADRGEMRPIYRFGEGAIDEHEIAISESDVQIPGYGLPVNLTKKNPYEDMT